MSKFIRTVIWQNLDRVGTEYCTAWKSSDDWMFEGVACRVDGNDPVMLTYQILCDANWSTRRVDLQETIADETKEVVLTVDGDHDKQWYSGDSEQLELKGCSDVDFSFSPVTNTLPIRRLNLSEGESQTIRAVWVRSPGLEIQPLDQEYSHLSRELYQYKSLTGFSTEISVDDLGLVVSYRDRWMRRATK